MLFILATAALSTFAQESTSNAKFIIQDAKLNKVDITETIISKGCYLVFYTVKESEDIFFGNIMPKDNTQSWGRIFNSKGNTTQETEEEYKFELITFKWSYQNDYDKKKGTATVRLKKIYKPVGVAFECTIIPENLDVIEYKGYMDGSLQVD